MERWCSAVTGITKMTIVRHTLTPPPEGHSRLAIFDKTGPIESNIHKVVFRFDD
jgi:hypothetical protein